MASASAARIRPGHEGFGGPLSAAPMAARLARLAVVLALAGRASAQGGPPMLTNDPGTPGAGHVELNLATAAELAPGAHVVEAPIVDFNLGAGEHVQLTVETALLETPDAPSHVGLGDVAAGVKWRFLDAVGSLPLAVSVFPQVALLSFGGEPHTGGRPVELLLPVEATYAFGRLGANLEAGYAFRRDDPEVVVGLALGTELAEGTDVAAEVQEAVFRTTGTHERYANVGLRRALGPATLLASVGHRLPTGDGPAREWIAYVGVQLTR